MRSLQCASVFVVGDGARQVSCNEIRVVITVQVGKFKSDKITCIDTLKRIIEISTLDEIWLG